MMNKLALAKTEITAYKIISLFLIVYFIITLIVSWPSAEHTYKKTELNQKNYYSCYDWGNKVEEGCTFGQALVNDFEINLILLPLLPTKYINNKFFETLYIIILLTSPILMSVGIILIYKRNNKHSSPTNNL